MYMNERKEAPDLRENKMRTMPEGKLLFTMALPLALCLLTGCALVFMAVILSQTKGK